MLPITISEVSRELAIPVRMAQLDPPRTEWGDAVSPGDIAADSVHFAATLGDEIVGVASVGPEGIPLVPEASAARLRGLAVVKAYRSQGIGTSLFRAQRERAKSMFQPAWFYARLRLSGFYTREGFVRTNYTIHHKNSGEVWLFVNQPANRLLLAKTGAVASPNNLSSPSQDRVAHGNVTSAPETWNEFWRSPEVRLKWTNPEPRVLACIPMLRERGALDVLDLGCGIGRHARTLATEGFRVRGVEASTTGLLEAVVGTEGSPFDLGFTLGLMTDIPYPPAAFDYVLAWHVIHHGSGQVVRATLREIARVLRNKGIVQLTMLSDRHPLFGKGREISPHTYVIDGHRDLKDPHFFSDETLVRSVVSEHFRILQLSPTETGTHWHVIAEKRGAN